MSVGADRLDVVLKFSFHQTKIVFIEHHSILTCEQKPFSQIEKYGIHVFTSNSRVNIRYTHKQQIKFYGISAMNASDDAHSMIAKLNDVRNKLR